MIRYIVIFCIVELIFFVCGIVDGSGAHFEETEEKEHKEQSSYGWMAGVLVCVIAGIFYLFPGGFGC